MTRVPIRVVIADDHQLFRDGLRGLLDDHEHLTVVGEAATGEEAVEVALREAPDVVIMDLHLPDIDGVVATGRILTAEPAIGVLMLTMFDADESLFAAMRAGARGYLLKGARHGDVIRAVEAIADGDAIFGSAMAERLVHYFAQGTGQAPRPLPELTEREREILALVGSGQTNLAIARKLGVTEKTVRNHLSNIFAKLHVADRGQAVIRARDAGLT